jgi:hypothetical protein
VHLLTFLSISAPTAGDTRGMLASIMRAFTAYVGSVNDLSVDMQAFTYKHTKFQEIRNERFISNEAASYYTARLL